MISHDRIWSAIDTLAARHGLTASGLARRAGLDPTAFNKSKRASTGGRLRWPTTESLAKVLTATGTTPEDLVALIGVGERKGLDKPMEAPPAPGFLGGEGAAAAIRASVTGRAPTVVYKVPDNALAPLYRAGDRLVLDLVDPIGPGARVVAVDRDGVVLVGEVKAWDDEVALAIPGQDGDSLRVRRDITFAARIIWASQ
ncbi:MAG TPA: helix-turn-helix transcriptional regulator [Methylomirabilota bacterium]|nr:helix-turn-helix transcriptional regulator [Methylomirabilota bacterium]